MTCSAKALTAPAGILFMSKSSGYTTAVFIISSSESAEENPVESLYRAMLSYSANVSSLNTTVNPFYICAKNGSVFSF